MTSDDVLFVLDELRTPDFTDWVFCVITGDEEDRESVSGRTGCWPFELGEIVVLNGDGREPFNEGRKPAKWWITYEQFDTLADARACRARVLGEQKP